MLPVIWSVATEISLTAELAPSTDSITPCGAEAILSAPLASDSAALFRRVQVPGIVLPVLQQLREGFAELQGERVDGRNRPMR